MKKQQGTEILFNNNFRLEVVPKNFLEIFILLFYLPDFEFSLPLSVHFKYQVVGRGNVKPDIGNRSIITQLNLIKDKLDQNQKTFIASSVLIAIYLQHSENLCAKFEGTAALITFLEACEAEQGLNKYKKYRFEVPD